MVCGLYMIQLSFEQLVSKMTVTVTNASVMHITTSWTGNTKLTYLIDSTLFKVQAIYQALLIWASLGSCF